MSLGYKSSSIDSNVDSKNEFDTSLAIEESSIENSFDEEDEESIIKGTLKKKLPLRIESDESESEVSRENIEVCEATNSSEHEETRIENENSEDEVQQERGINVDVQSQIEKAIDGRPSVWEENNILSSTRLYGSLGDFCTPKQTQKVNLKESFLTPREIKYSSSDSEDSVTELIPRQSDVIEVSSDEEEPPPTPLKTKQSATVQKKLDDFIEHKTTIQTEPVISYVTQEEYNAQREKVFRLEEDLSKMTNTLRTVNLSALPDKGTLILQRHDKLHNALIEEKAKFEKMTVHSDQPPNLTSKAKILSSWDEMQKATDLVQARTQGERALATLNAQKVLTVELLTQLQSSLKTCPDENTFAEDPKGLKVELMPHQKRALAWLVFRETQKPAGGILADDMGLGKTLTMISLLLKEKADESQNAEDENDERYARSGKYKGGTLVICPASLINQWEGEVASKTKRGYLDTLVYHGPKRERKPKRLATHDLVITTYSIIQNEYEKHETVFGVRWHRIILDEAHQIRNYKSRTSVAVCHLSAKKRWALTGTPVHNKEEDMYSLLKFLRCTPFDDLAVWKRWIANKNTGGQNRLSVVIASLLLRRTKADLLAAGTLQCLPERKWELITVNLDKDEMDVYHKVLVFSRTLFAQFLHQRAEKGDGNYLPFNSANPEYQKMYQKLVKLNRLKEVKQHHILVLLLRLRQICCHPCLITTMLENMDSGDNDEHEDTEELNILEQLNRLELEDDHYDPAVGLANEPVGLAEASKGILNPSHPVFSSDRLSSKINVVLQVLKAKVLPTTDKAIIVSQWTSLLQLIGKHLKAEGIKFNELNGSIPVHKRMCLVDDFNNPNHPVRVMLLSLTAGGVGLNLVGGNHLFLVDLHWNPQLEMQAQDRIYRVGQKKNVNVYKFMTLETIEERIKKLQENKLSIADSMLTGSKIQSSKLTLADLKMLFT